MSSLVHPKAKPPSPKSRAVAVTAHILVVAYALSGVVIQFFVPRFVDVLSDMGEGSLSFVTILVMRFQQAWLLAAIAFASLAVLVAWRSHCRLPLPRATVVLLVLTTLLSGMTTFALMQPMSGVIQEATRSDPPPAKP